MTNSFWNFIETQANFEVGMEELGIVEIVSCEPSSWCEQKFDIRWKSEKGKASSILFSSLKTQWLREYLQKKKNIQDLVAGVDKIKLAPETDA